MSEPKKTAKPKAITDVAHPGKSAPSDTSKPIITHRPRMKDPMVVVETPTSELEDTAKTPLSKKTGELKIIPAAGPAAEEPDEKEAQPKDKPETEPDKPEVPGTDSPDEPEEPETETEAETESDKGKKPKQPDLDAEAAAQAEQDAKLQRVIDSKKYFLPINAVEQRRSKRFVALGILLAVLLALAWVDIALDAGLIQINNIKPVTHFFSN